MPEQPTAGHSGVPVGDTRALGIGNNAGSFLLPSRSSLLEQFPHQRTGQHAALLVVDGGHLSGGAGELRFRQRDAQAAVRDLHPGGGGALAMAQAEYKLAKENLASTDTLYRIGQQRHRIAAISQADLLTLKLDKVNAQNTLQNRASALKRAMFSLASFLNLDKNTQIELELPSRPSMMEIPVDEALRWGRSNNPQLLELKQNVLEAERNVDRTKKESRFNASVNASIGFNQVAENFGDVYHKPMQQDLIAVSVSIPLLDWGVRKGKYNMARNNLNVVKISARQDEISIEEEVIMTVSDFNIQQQLIASAEEALDLAILAYNETRQRFIIGKADINSLTLSLNRQQEAQRNYISALQNYWLNYYKIRRLTLFDFATKLSLSDRFDFNGGRLIR